LAPLQRQAELLEEAMRRQVEFEKDLVGKVLAPVGVLLDLLDQTATAMRTQAQAFEAAAEAFNRSAGLLEVQASLLEDASRSMRDPARALRSAGGAVAGGRRRGRGSSSP